MKLKLRDWQEKAKLKCLNWYSKSDDNRSYHINSDKIKKILNFTPKYSIEDAILELCNAFKKKLLKNTFDDDFYFNVKRLQNIQAK